MAERTYDEIKDRQALRDEVKKGLRDEASGWGIKLLRFYIPDVGRVNNIRVLSDSDESMAVIPNNE